MAKLKAETFIDLLRRSGLVEKDRLHAALSELKDQVGAEALADTELVVNRLVQAGLITRWQADKLLEGRYKGFFLGRHKLLDHLGTGGMSSVYLAEHVLMQRRVAIKVLPKNRVEDMSYLERFYREARAAAALDHHNIVRAYDVDNDGTNHYLVMEYVEGRDLQQMVKEDGPLDYVAAADYIRQAAEGLAHAHQAGLIHRDVKPANLLVDRRNVVKVLDLGLARFTDEQNVSLTETYDENVLGTADYLAPEQALDSHDADARADIYALGCTLYYVLTGHPPFPGGTLPQRLMRHQKQPPPNIQAERPDAPNDLVNICLKMMAKKPGQRYQSAAEVAEVLADWLRQHGQSLDGGSRSGLSSGRLVGAVSGDAASAVGRQAPTRKPAKEPSAPQAAPSDVARPASMPPLPRQPISSTDTVANLSHATLVKGAGSSQVLGGRRSAKQLPRARPLELEPVSEYVTDADLLSPPPRKQQGPLPEGDLGAYLARHKHSPQWLWLVIAGGAGVLLLMALLLWLIAG